MSALPVVGADVALGIVSRRDLLKVSLRFDAKIPEKVTNTALRRTLLLEPVIISDRPLSLGWAGRRRTECTEAGPVGRIWTKRRIARYSGLATVAIPRHLWRLVR